MEPVRLARLARRTVLAATLLATLGAASCAASAPRDRDSQAPPRPGGRSAAPAEGAAPSGVAGPGAVAKGESPRPGSGASAGESKAPPRTPPPGRSGDAAVARTGRFFLAGDGEISLRNGHTGERLRVRYRNADGTYRSEALDRIDALFRSRGDDERTRVSLRLVEIINFLQDRKKPDAVVLMSGYRSSEYNAAVIARGGRAARASMHTEGLAADLVWKGLDPRQLWLDVRELECCGVGYYASGGFLHLDVGRPRFWEESTSGVDKNLSQGNARVIARTDFDRYADLDGAVVGLHAVTLRPLRIARTAEFAPDTEGAPTLPLRLDLLSGGPATTDAAGCFEMPASGHPDPIAFRVAPDGAATAPSGPTRGRIVIRTCEPRLEATPDHVDTNPVEVHAPLTG